MGWLQGFKGRGGKCSYLHHLPCCDVSFPHLLDLHTVSGIPGKIKAEGSCPRLGWNGACVGRKLPPPHPTCPLSYGQSHLLFLCQLRDGEPFWKRGNQTWLCSENPSSREFADVWRALRYRSGANRSLFRHISKGWGTSDGFGSYLLRARALKEGNSGLNPSLAIYLTCLGNLLNMLAPQLTSSTP